MRTQTFLPFAFATSLLVAACTGGATSAPAATPLGTPVPATPGPATPGPATPAPATPAPATPAPATPAPPTTEPQSTAPGKGGADTVDGRTFLSTAVDGHALVAGSVIRLSFDGKQIGIHAGCNSMGGEWRFTGDKVSIGMLATTEMACDEPLMAQDQWIAAFLDGATMRLDGDTLTFAKDGVTLTMGDKAVVEPAAPITGTTWALESIIVGGDAVSSIPGGVVASITIVDGRAQVAAGCNRGAATVEVADATLTFGPMALTRMACGDDAMAVEETVVNVLTGTVGFAIDGDTLTITGAANGLIFRATP